jgi:hypothetical protein
MQLQWIKLVGVIVLYALAILSISYVGGQSDFLLQFSSYSLAFAAFLFCIRVKDHFSLKTWKRISFVLFLIPFFAAPSLSPDVYRFLWDGELVTMGIHPYAFTPNEYMSLEGKEYASEYMNLLYGQLTELSQHNFSTYPTVNQLYFLLVALCSDDLFVSLVLLRILMMLSIMLGTIYLIKILNLLSIPSTNGILLLLNPILIVEVIGNFHFEGVMLSWLMMGIYFLLKHQWVKSSFFWAIAINIKLTPLILLPFLIRFRNIRTSIKLYLLTFLFSGALILIYLWPTLFWNYMQSIELYFDNFEFNAGIFYLVKWITSFIIDGNPTLIVGPALSLIAFISILFIAFYKPIKNSKEWLNRMMWGYVVYLLLATTVHPWYVILPLGLAVFSKNIGVLFWSYLIMLSYGFYAFGNATVGYALIGIEYTLLIWFLVFPNSFVLTKVRSLLKLNSGE